MQMQSRKIFRWFDLPVCIFVGLTIGGFFYMAAPCLIHGMGIGACALWGIFGTAAAFHDLPLWIMLPDKRMMYLVGGSSIVALFLTIFFRWLRLLRRTKVGAETN
jgi:hypothetical protein